MELYSSSNLIKLVQVILIQAQTIDKYQFPFDISQGYFAQKLKVDPSSDFKINNRLVKSFRWYAKNDEDLSQHVAICEVHFEDGKKVFYDMPKIKQCDLNESELYFILNSIKKKYPQLVQKKESKAFNLS